MKFEELNVTEKILTVLNKNGYKEASPIQEQAIPAALIGKDILGCAQTGTGKTAAFAIPTLQLLEEREKDYVRALVLTPTRELAVQIQESFQNYGRRLNLKTTCVFGGVKQGSQRRSIKNGVDIIIATPGRLNDLIQQRIVDLRNIEIFVLDEADRMLDMGFLPDVKKIIDQMPEEKQTMLFSATMPPAIATLANSLLRHPVNIEVAPVSSTADNIEQVLYYVDRANKKRLLVDLIASENVFTGLVFTRTKVGADRLTKYLNDNGVIADAIHGDKSQNARQRALKAFKKSTIQILVATDIAARGIDVNELEFVFNFDIPNEPESYVHRIGRTARAGLSGKSISFCDINEKSFLKDIEKLIGKKIKVIEEHQYPMEELTPSNLKPGGKHKKRSSRSQKQGKSKKTSSNKRSDNHSKGSGTSKRGENNQSNKTKNKNSYKKKTN